MRAWIDYRFFRRQLLGTLGGPFNGQQQRQRIFDAIVGALHLHEIVETGSLYGRTTAYMAARVQAPIVTVEINPYFASVARRFLKPFGHVRVVEADSGYFLEAYTASPRPRSKPRFFYLDAHWYGEIPLLQELAIVLDRFDNPVIMIDDFQVPGDAGFKFDSAPDGMPLSLDYLRPIADRSFDIYFPSAPSDQETGARSGAVVLVKGEIARPAIATISELKHHGTSAQLGENAGEFS